MKLSNLIKKLEIVSIEPRAVDFEVRGLSCNSKDISPGFIFVAVKGTHIDASRFIPDASGAGAGAVVFEDSPFSAAAIKECEGQCVFIKVKDSRNAAALLAAEFYSRPSSAMHLIGITGTNGKTTVSYLIEAIVKEAGGSPGVIGTVNYRFKDKILPAYNTTPGPLELQSLLDKMRRAGVTHVAMEVSSHALDQERTAGADFKSAVFTNLTQDHLDYHHTQEDYFLAKSRLFEGLSGDALAVINIDDAFGRRLMGMTKARKAAYSIDAQADILARDVRFDMRHTEFILSAGGSNEHFKSGLIGRHNVYNILAAVAWGLNSGISLSTLKSAIEKFSFVPGRLERLSSSAPFGVFVDYAHTEDALKNVLKTLRELSPKRIITVFGCGGERDKAKRPLMGRVVSELSDYFIITSDNPRSEDPAVIIEDIKAGVKKDNYCVIQERGESICKAVSLAREGDIVLLAGKGHEDYQVLKTGRVHFDDREVARECLASLKY